MDVQGHACSSHCEVLLTRFVPRLRHLFYVSPGGSTQLPKHKSSKSKATPKVVCYTDHDPKCDHGHITSQMLCTYKAQGAQKHAVSMRYCTLDVHARNCARLTWRRVDSPLSH